MKQKPYFLLDIARRFYSLSELKYAIDIISAAGYAGLHLHFSDDQGYAIESSLLGQEPNSSAYANSIYTNIITEKPFLSKLQIQELVEYATNKGIEIIPELGSPGHMAALFELYDAKYPSGPTIRNDYGELRYTTPHAIEFIQQLFIEVKETFKNINIIHIGGDEHGAAYNHKYNYEFIAYVNTQVEFLKSIGLRSRMWNDGVHKDSLNHLNKDVEITYWAWDGDKPAEREHLTSIRASMPDLLGNEFTVINANSYFTYSVPSGDVDKITHDAQYAASDAKSRWTPGVWDSEYGTSPVDPNEVYSSMMSVWGENIPSDISNKDLLDSLRPHIQSIADISNEYTVHVYDNFINSESREEKTMTLIIECVEDIATTTVGDVTLIELASYYRFIPFGGGLLEVAPSNTPIVNGYTFKSADGKVLRRIYSETGGVELTHFGWTPETRGDVTNMLVAALKAASTANTPLVLPRSAILRVNGLIAVPSNTVIIGNNSTALFSSNVLSTITPVGGEKTLTVPTVVSVNTSQQGFITDKAAISVSEFHIDYDDVAPPSRLIGWWLIDQTDSVIQNCNINSFKNHTVLTRVGTKSTKDSVGLRLENIIGTTKREGPNDARLNFYADIDDGNSTRMDVVWAANKAVILNTPYRHKNISIKNCTWMGGRYGQAMYGTEDSTSDGTTTVNTIRGIVHQNLSRNNIHTNVTIRQVGSSPLLFNYGTHDCVVDGVDVRSSVSTGQAFAQMTLNPERNVVRNGYCELTLDYAMNWFIYMGVNAVGNIVENVKIKGAAKHTCVAIESVIHKDHKVGYAAATGGSLDWSSKDSTGNTVRNVTFEGNTTGPVFSLYAGQSGTNEYNLTDTTIENIQIIGAKYSTPELVRANGTGGKCTGIFKNVFKSVVVS